MPLKIYGVICALAICAVAYGDLTGRYPSYGLFSGESSRRPGQRGGFFFFGGGGYYRGGGGGYHAK